jgi:hypothetical protein
MLVFGLQNYRRKTGIKMMILNKTSKTFQFFGILGLAGFSFLTHHRKMHLLVCVCVYVSIMITKERLVSR